MAVPLSVPDFIRPGTSDLEPDPCEPGGGAKINTPRQGEVARTITCGIAGLLELVPPRWRATEAISELGTAEPIEVAAIFYLLWKVGTHLTQQVLTPRQN